MMPSNNVLEVFVSPGCRGCNRAVELVNWIREVKPDLPVEVVDLSLRPDAGLGVVFGVPTYVYNGKPVFLGNPARQQLEVWLEQLELED